MRKLEVGRRQLFEGLDRPALSPLPAEPYIYAEWRIRRVSLDYHVDIDGHYYSVPHRLLRAQVEEPATARTVELLHKDGCAAVHSRGKRARTAHDAGRAYAAKPVDAMLSGRSNAVAAEWWRSARPPQHRLNSSQRD
jgi:hypothetical protein